MRSSSDHYLAALYKPSGPHKTMTPMNLLTNNVRNSSKSSQSSLSLDRNRDNNFYRTMSTVGISGRQKYTRLEKDQPNQKDMECQFGSKSVHEKVSANKNNNNPES